MVTHSVLQGSEEWFALRLKYPLSASHAQAIGNQGKGLETLCWEKVAERYSSSQKERMSNEHTDRGNELEAQARKIYELQTGNEVTEVGFVTDDSISKVGGASPDGLVSDDGLLEIKCFDDAKHFRATIEREVESKYRWQGQQQLLFTGRKWVDFGFYNPNFKESLVIIRMEADEEMQRAIREGLAKGEEIIKGIEAKIK